MDGGDTGIDDDIAVRGDVNIGATVMGRNRFGPVRGPWPDDSWTGWWGEEPPYHHPVFVLTHHARDPIPMQGGTTFHFVTDGIESAMTQAFDAAGGKDVRLGGGASVIQQYLGSHARAARPSMTELVAVERPIGRSTATRTSAGVLACAHRRTIAVAVAPTRQDGAMGVNNKQRRAAKRRGHRGRSARPSGDRHRAADDRYLVIELVHAAAEALRAGDRDDAGELIAMLDAAPRTLVREVLVDQIGLQRALLGRNGWTDGDCGELERRRLKVPSSASDVERSVRLLALFCDLPPLPPMAAPRVEARDDDGTLAKIRALLAKAESTTFPAEAEALSAKAQELIARHRIDRVLLDGGSADGPVGRRIWLDDPYADAKAQLLDRVAAANRCRSIQLVGVGCCRVIGFPVDLDVVELLHTSLLVQATTALAAAGPQKDARGRSRTRSFRQSFLIAYAVRIGERLLDAATCSETDAVAEARAGGVELLPVLAARDALVDDAVTVAFPRLTTVRGSVTNAAGWAAGTAAADAADLSVGERLER